DEEDRLEGRCLLQSVLFVHVENHLHPVRAGSPACVPALRARASCSRCVPAVRAREAGRAWVMGSVPSQVGSTAAHRPALPHRTVPAPLPRPGPGSTAPVNGPTRIVLASASPRRAELLRGLGLSFGVEPADVDETVRAGEAPDALVARLSVA